ncbi:multidrug efflux SMR transporter [Epibacterium ulvae]|uniref:DMT family transporter n=1 Tax=Epibacterium ulvae TaxID=1156985 RepID=UPI001BFC23A8|nr:multidrug efflux SMR transporter [Epibacterium ulvae]MBT8155036.1 multidrug efflux SMR transporter [Epibacterium ulvae]
MDGLANPSFAGSLETAWAICLKYTDGLTRLVPTTITLVLVLISLYMLSLSLKQIPVGTAYAVWSGIGAAGTVIIGILILAEPVSWPRMICVALILIGDRGIKIGRCELRLGHARSCSDP